MEEKGNVTHRGKVIVTIIICCILGLIISWCITAHRLSNTLAEESKTTTEDFTDIMNEYTHSFRLYEKYLQLEIATASSTDDIAAFLKSNDEKLQEIDGEDYDGVYMYYEGKYLYSWDTPYSEYEESGYDATKRPWYTGAVEAKGDICFSVPYRSYANEYMLATISRLQPDGKTVIAYDIKLGAIQSFTEKLDLYKGSLTMVCDKDGNIIGTTNSQYAGGNYKLSQEEYEAQITTADKELSEISEDSSAAEEDVVKAQKKLESLQELKKLCSKNQKAIEESVSAPKEMSHALGRGSICYTYSTDEYDCITLVPIMQMMPTIIGIWAVISALLVLSILLWESVQMRMQHAKELKVKNEQLAQAVVRADAASVAKSQFLAQMSHEIRTPMNAVIGMTSIAKTEIRSPEKVADSLTKIEASSKLLLSIINDVLDMSAIEGGKLKIDSAEFNFKGLISNITTVFYEQARQKGINFEVRMNGVTEEHIVGDELRVNQILMNLLSNAIKFTPANGEIDLMILQASRSQDKVQMRFSVSDTGCGMSEEMQHRLFQPFEQESASTARKHGGSGLGLSITKSLVEMMGGTIKVKSTQGKGSVFTADIPFKVSEKADEAVTTVSDFSEIHALVVDDSKDSCEYSGILLERLGVRYEYVMSGEQALEALEEAEDKGDPYTLCLIDWKMPEMDGGELTQNIREIFGEDAIIIIVSAYDLNEVEATGRDIGSNYFIPKPLFQSTLFNALMKISGGDYTKIEAQEDKEFDFSGKHVLVAEDVTLNMEVAVKLLNMVGVEVTCAEDGRQAVDLFVQGGPGKYDCILMDINMPVMDGYEAARAIRKFSREDAKTIPIYAMTANAFSEDVTAALDAGMNGHIAKPIETKVLYRTLDTAFSLNSDSGAVAE